MFLNTFLASSSLFWRESSRGLSISRISFEKVSLKENTFQLISYLALFIDRWKFVRRNFLKEKINICDRNHSRDKKYKNVNDFKYNYDNNNICIIL